MPTTVNGIGTHYYGNRNRQVRNAACRACGAVGALASYDTRLWFVIIFVPVIPLGRKRIIDECPRCRRHFVAKADEYAVGSQLAVSEAREKYLRAPTVQSALEAHARMLGYHQHDEADALRKQALEQFPRDAALRCAFANHLNQMNRYTEAVPLYEEAFRLDPHLPDARIGVAFNRMNETKLDEARKLLDFLEKPGAGQLYALGPLETLAVQYQQQGRHQEAVDLFRHLLNEYPDAAQNHAVRKMVRMSEKKLGTQETVLPDRTGSWLNVFHPWSPQFSQAQRAIAFISLVVTLIAVGVATNLVYVGQHRTLHILSGLAVPVMVQVDDRAPISVASHERVVLPEGSHRVLVSGPYTAQYDVPMQSPFWSRMFRNPVWIVNVAGTAGLAQAQVHYAVNPIPPTITVLSGQTVIALPHIDYPFVDPPNSLDLSKHNQVRTKSALMTAPVEPRVFVAQIIDPDRAFDYLEAHLATRPDNGLLFYAYQERVKKQHAEARAEAFLKAGLERRPIEINWHRTYQNLLEEANRVDELVTQYDAALAKDPDNGELIYLRSRIEDDPVQARTLLDRAKTAASKSPWPWYSIGYHSMCRGDWPAAHAEFQQAEQLGMDQELLRGSVFTARLALGEADAVIAENRAAVQQDVRDGAAMSMLLNALATKGEADVARQELAAWKARIATAQIMDSAAMVEVLQQFSNYELGDFDALQARLENSNDPTLQPLRCALWLAAGQPERIANDTALREAHFNGPWDSLSLSVAFHAIGKEAEAETWRTKACDQLGARTGFDKRTAQWLSSEQPPEFGLVEQSVADPNEKLILLCALAQKFPELREPSASLAHKLNVNRTPPYHLIARVFPP